MEQSTIVRAVRGGLVNMIPVLIIGAFALVFRFLPIDAYRDFIHAFGNGVLDKIFLYVNSATFGVLSVYMTYSISRSYMKVKADAETVNGGAIFASLLAFFILSGAFLEGFGSTQMGVKSMMLAIVAVVTPSVCYTVSDAALSTAGYDSPVQLGPFEMQHVIWAAALFIIASMSIRWWSTNCRHTPFPQ